VTVHDVPQTIASAVDTFYLDREGLPELVPIGLAPLDAELGGLGPQSCGILAAATGVGKSSAMLAAMLTSPVKVGAISMEDGADVVGTRLLAAQSGIDSLRIRRKALSKKELAAVNKVVTSNKLDHMFFSYQIGKSLDQVCVAIKELTDIGCKMIWVDYLQEIRGHNKNDRRNEVAEAMSRCHGQAAAGGAALMAISQFRRVGEDLKTGLPRPVGIHHLKESGDLENKARIIVIAQKQPSPDGADRVRFKLAKSTYGGEYIRWDMVRDPSGTLRDAKFYSPTEDF
jgi:replicative DNA helicase